MAALGGVWLCWVPDGPGVAPGVVKAPLLAISGGPECLVAVGSHGRLAVAWLVSSNWAGGGDLVGLWAGNFVTNTGLAHLLVIARKIGATKNPA